jgi:hypothetical protein
LSVVVLLVELVLPVEPPVPVVVVLPVAPPVPVDPPLPLVVVLPVEPPVPVVPLDDDVVELDDELDDDEATAGAVQKEPSPPVTVPEELLELEVLPPVPVEPPVPPKPDEELLLELVVELELDDVVELVELELEVELELLLVVPVPPAPPRGRFSPVAQATPIRPRVPIPRRKCARMTNLAVKGGSLAVPG